jgi:hypothetical protein
LEDILKELSAAWSKKDIDYLREYFSHAEYGLALEEMIGIAARKNWSFTPDQKRRVETLVRTMEIKDSSTLEDLRKL